MTRPFVIGVTGRIACGKSSVMAILGELGAYLIDSDSIYHRLIVVGSPLNLALQEHFGAGVADARGEIDRKALGHLVFSDPAALARLDALTHPAVIEAVAAEIADSPAPVVAVDAVKLIESGMHTLCDSVWRVDCSRERQIERLISRNGLSRVEAELRVSASASLPIESPEIDVVIDNSGALLETEERVRAAWATLPILPKRE